MCEKYSTVCFVLKTNSHTEVLGLTDDISFKFSLTLELLLADVYVEIIGYYVYYSPKMCV